MSPPMSCSIITLAVSRDTRNEPLAITLCCRSQSFTVVSSSGLDSDSPALLTTRSTPPNASAAAATMSATACSSDTSARTATATSAPPSSSATACALSRLRSAMTTQPPSAATRVAMALPMPEPAPVTSATRVASAFGFGIRCQLGLFQRPVLDGELLRLADRRVGGHGLGAAHHVDRVDVELAGDPGGLLVLAEGEHPHAGHQHDRRVRAPDRGRLGGGVAVVVGLVVRRGRRGAAP